MDRKPLDQLVLEYLDKLSNLPAGGSPFIELADLMDDMESSALLEQQAREMREMNL